MVKIEKFKIKNYMEDLVLETMDSVMKVHGDICKCDRCRSDIIALALNFLPPRYVATELGETYTKIRTLDHQFRVDVFTAISRAVNTVANSPRHNHNKDKEEN